MSFKDQPLQLVSTDQNNKFYLTTPAKQYLTSITKPISIVSIAGMYRTGKSYLVNRLLKIKQTGFRTGATTQSVTKGLNIWGRPISATDQTGQQFYYIVIDSEGIGSCEQELKYDMKLMTLIFMISSTVLYNSMGAIDEQTLDQLRVIVNLKNTLAELAQKQKTKLVWVLRDFALQLADKNGLQITSNQYLQQCLQDCLGTSEETKKKNEIRRAIRQGLGKKACFTLVRPTINEEDLVNLNRCKLRTEFVNQIQTIRQEVFSGCNQDLKKIDGHMINGRMLAGLIQKCIQVLNGHMMPNLLSIWQSVRTEAYEEHFTKICQQLKSQISHLSLHSSKQELKLKLNEIVHKYSRLVEQNFVQIDAFKKYNKKFLNLAEKLKTQIINSNASMTKQKRLKELRQFVKHNISFANIQPTNMSLIKTVIDRMQLKVHGEPEGYEYTLAVLFDMMKVSEQKASYMHKQLSQLRKMVEASNAEQKNHYLTALGLKKDYHEALKTINNLKIAQEEYQKQIALSKHQLEVHNNTLQNLQQQKQIRQSALLRQIQDINFRNRQKNDQLSNVIKGLREQNTQLVCELSHVKEQRLREGLSERKEAIFQQKMKQAWQKFADQRKQMRTELQKSRKNVQYWRLKYEQQIGLRQQLEDKFSKQTAKFTSKQTQFAQQIKQLKNMHAQAKKTYFATFDTLKDNDKILKSIQNVAVTTSNQPNHRKVQSDDRQIEAVKKNCQKQLEKSKIQAQEKLRRLSEELQQLKKINEKIKNRCFQSQSQLRECQEQKQELEKQLVTIRQKFVDNLSEVQNSKERQRALYEQSIVRLLANLDKRERGQYNSFYR